LHGPGATRNFAAGFPAHTTQQGEDPGVIETQKRKAAEKAVEFVRSGMRVGLGTGSTARHVVDVIAEKLEEGSLEDIVGVPTSRATETHARAAGIPLATLEEVQSLDVTIDGADEIDPRLELIKGHGGALLWEKLVACASRRLIIVADTSKLVDRLGSRMALPVEVIPFGWSTHLEFFQQSGARASLRRNHGEPVVTDGGHFLVDCHFDGGIADPAEIATRFKARPGIVDTGLFLGLAQEAVVAGAEGVRVLTRSGV
jgi:ribose 5-phosphate isomerase A